MDHEALNPGFPLTNAHVMTLAGAFWVRKRDTKHALATSEPRLFSVAPKTKLLGYCCIDPVDKERPTLIVVHGLESSSESPDVVNIAEKTILARMNVVRLNLRNCGDTMRLSPTLYNAGNSADILAVVKELRERDGLRNIFIVGYSLGGNIVVKLVGELGADAAKYISGVCAISPAIDLAACVDVMDRGFNRVYAQRFLISLRAKIRKKHKIQPSIPLEPLQRVKTVRAFDDLYTAPDAGFRDAAEYYEKSSAIKLLDKIAVPCLIITAKDDPLVPFSQFEGEDLKNNANITLLAPSYGGHAGFINRNRHEHAYALDAGIVLDRFWAENRVLQFCDLINRGRYGAHNV
jgi:hypothetical protein